jgi:PTH1 family peptidyl-tRNA hydrolase
VERLASQENIRLRARESRSRVGRGTVEGERVLLALPQTLMNASGEAVSALCKSNGIDPSDVCIVFDDVALPLGTLRLRARGSAGGQKGMASILSSLGTTEIPRLRLGGRGEILPAAGPGGLRSRALRERRAGRIRRGRRAGGRRSPPLALRRDRRRNEKRQFETTLSGTRFGAGLTSTRSE